MLKLGERCKHGLYCICHICEYEKEISKLRAENEQLKEALTHREDDPHEYTCGYSK